VNTSSSRFDPSASPIGPRVEGEEIRGNEVLANTRIFDAPTQAREGGTLGLDRALELAGSLVRGLA
jgi:hypothetical protein